LSCKHGNYGYWRREPEDRGKMFEPHLHTSLSCFMTWRLPGIKECFEAGKKTQFEKGPVNVLPKA
jgi:hypothetical protein